LRKAEAAEKSKDIGKDDLNRLEKQIDEKMAAQKTEIDNLSKTKEQEILTV